MSRRDAAGGDRWDAIVVGGGVGALVSATYLALARLRVLVVEARDGFGGGAETGTLGEGASAPLVADTLYALDQTVTRELGLHRRGLEFSEQAMPLVAMRSGGRHLVLAHETYTAQSAIRAVSKSDAGAYLEFRRELYGLARRLRPLWMPEYAHPELGVSPATVDAAARHCRLSARDCELLHIFAHSSVTSYLDRWFETEELKTAIGIDTARDGLVPQEAGSALQLLWAAAQECGGNQGAVSQLQGGPGALVDALAEAAREAGARLRSGVRIGGILAENGHVTGVELDDGEILRTPLVLSSLGLVQTLSELVQPDAIAFGAAPPARPPRLASARLLFVLNGLPPFAGLGPSAFRGRLIMAERPDSTIDAKNAALAGALPEELVIAATIPSVADGSLVGERQHVLSLRIPYLPLEPEGGWAVNEDTLRKRVLSIVESYAPGLSDRITSGIVLTPRKMRVRYGSDRWDGNVVDRLLTPYEHRLRTPLRGLYLCGGAGEPAEGISGRAGRIAAALAMAERRRNLEEAQ